MNDCVYYYSGGYQQGKWSKAAKGTVPSLLRQGYPAVDGNSKVGPPDGYPKAALRRRVNAVCGSKLWPETETVGQMKHAQTYRERNKLIHQAWDELREAAGCRDLDEVQYLAAHLRELYEEDAQQALAEEESGIHHDGGVNFASEDQ